MLLVYLDPQGLGCTNLKALARDPGSPGQGSKETEGRRKGLEIFSSRHAAFLQMYASEEASGSHPSLSGIHSVNNLELWPNYNDPFGLKTTAASSRHTINCKPDVLASAPPTIPVNGEKPFSAASNYIRGMGWGGDVWVRGAKDRKMDTTGPKQVRNELFRARK
ncbi:hypothetical protein ACRALDRAFT_212130 [Sodiomyces alcalophilus JCM 7366]|uniref:uncharacterized protein n=1 Tax=Sodiomyces alcalophilus JCM 7366 TaxID=591952 RepID=UPI0039B573FE